MQDGFGEGAIALQGNTAFVGAKGNSNLPGSVYVLKRVGVSWQPVKRIVASDSALADGFGRSLAISGDTLVVGSSRDSVYIFERNFGGSENWGEVKKITTPTKIGDGFGLSVGMFRNTIVVSSPTHDGPPSCIDCGVVYIYGRNTGSFGNWGLVKQLRSTDPQPGIRFGTKLVISADTLVVGDSDDRHLYFYAKNQGGIDQWGIEQVIALDLGYFGDALSLAMHNTTLVLGDPIDWQAIVYEKDLTSNTWSMVKLLTDPASGDEGFGYRVAIYNDRIVVGSENAIVPGGTTDVLCRPSRINVYERNNGGVSNWGRAAIIYDTEFRWKYSPCGYPVAVSDNGILVGVARSSRIKGKVSFFEN